MPAVLILAGVGMAHAQGTSTPAGQQKGIVIYEAFEGGANSEGQVTTLTSSALITSTSTSARGRNFNLL